MDDGFVPYAVFDPEPDRARIPACLRGRTSYASLTGVVREGKRFFGLPTGVPDRWITTVGGTR